MKVTLQLQEYILKCITNRREIENKTVYLQKPLKRFIHMRTPAFSRKSELKILKAEGTSLILFGLTLSFFLGGA